jgi:hypothetical protein
MFGLKKKIDTMKGKWVMMDSEIYYTTDLSFIMCSWKDVLTEATISGGSV